MGVLTLLTPGFWVLVPDREESHHLSEDLGSGEPVSRASAKKINYEYYVDNAHGKLGCPKNVLAA